MGVRGWIAIVSIIAMTALPRPLLAQAASSQPSPLASAAPDDLLMAYADAVSLLSFARSSLTDATGIDFHGTFDLGVNYNFNQPAAGNNLYRAFDYFGASNFEPNQLELYFSRASAGWLPGFVIDLNFLNAAEVLYGNTTYYGRTHGAWNPCGWMDPTEVYLTYTLPLGTGLTVMAGRQTTLIGLEVIPTWNNINYNQSVGLLFALGEPLTDTGIRAVYSLNRYATVTLGINNGWDTIASKNLFQTVEGQLALTPWEDLSWNIQGTYGPATGSQAGSKLGAADTTILWKTPFRPLQVAMEYLYASQTAPVYYTPVVEGPAYPNPLTAPAANPIQSSVHWQGVGSWIVYDVTPNLRLATRGEWFSDPEGARTGVAQTLADITETLSYQLPWVAGLTGRLEYRYDLSGHHPFPNAGPYVTFPCFGDICRQTAHTYSGQPTLEAALIYAW
jgi:hypothetical protein